MVFDALVRNASAGSPRRRQEDSGHVGRGRRGVISCGRRDRGGPAGGELPGGDPGIPRLPGGDDGPDPAQQRGGARHAGLPVGEAAGLAAGQVLVFRGQRGVVPTAAPGSRPGDGVQPGAGSAGGTVVARETGTGKLVRASVTGIGAPTGWAGSVYRQIPPGPAVCRGKCMRSAGVICPRADDPTRAANASRSLRAVAADNRTQMAAVRHKMAKAEGAGIQDADGIERAWLRRGTAFPAVEHFLVAAPPAPLDHDAPASRPPGRRQHPQPTPRAEC